jgi:hypothetical protein
MRQHDPYASSVRLVRGVCLMVDFAEHARANRALGGQVQQMTNFATIASDTPVELSSGMVRDTSKGKPRFDLICPENMPYDKQMLTRFALLMARGAANRGDRNWEKADGPEDVARFKESAFRHFMAWFCGETDEDHAAATWFNMQGVEYVQTTPTD